MKILKWVVLPLFTFVLSCPAQLARTNALRIANTLTNLRLNYSLADSNGAFFLLQSEQLNNLLGAGRVIASGIAASNPVGSLEVGLPTNTTSFFALLHDPSIPVSPADFISVDDGDAAEAPAQFLIASPNVPDVLPANAPFPLTLNITDTNGNLVSTNGQIVLSLENGDGTAVVFNYTLSPATIGVTNGIAQATLTIQTTNSLADVFLAGTFAGPLTAARFGAATAAAAVPIGCATVAYSDYSDTDTVNWRYPLPAIVPLSGAFGEWPGHSDLHWGIDFAATSGTSVRAAKKGVVVKVGSLGSSGQFVAIYHGNGYVTRYLHVVPTVKRGCIVEADAVVGKVHGCCGHLHFEMLQLDDPTPFDMPGGYQQLNLNYGQGLANFPGSPVNPIGNPAFTFSPTLFTSGGQLPLVKAVFFRASQPALTALRMDPAVACLERLSDAPPSSPVYVVLQVVEQFPKPSDPNKPYLLPAKQITFTPDAGPATNIVYGLTQTDIEKLDPRGWTATDGAGYALLPLYESNATTAAAYRNWRYKYWFHWDTSHYTNSPHSFMVQAKDLAGSVGDPVVFTFGPKVIAVTPNQMVAGQWFFTNVAYLGTNIFPALTQPDRYQVDIIQANGTRMPGVQWGSPIQNGLTPVLTIHLQTNWYSFTLPPNTTPDGLKLRVSSRLATNIASEVCLCGGANMAFIPAGPFVMGDPFNDYPGSIEQPTHTVQVSGFCMDKYAVTKAFWDDVYNWGIGHGYSFDYGAQGKAANHPAQQMTWYDAAKWCNARSEKEGRVPAYYTSAAQTTVYRSGQVPLDNSWVKWNGGYRLPTEAEWEKAARGGAPGHRFPWADSDTISWNRANYNAFPASVGGYAYDVNPTQGLHPAFNDGVYPNTSPVDYFAPNGYGLYDMAGNVWGWCWDWYGAYSSGSQNDPHGATSGSDRVFRGGGWYNGAITCRSAFRYGYSPGDRYDYVGFRAVLAPGQP